RLDCSWRARAPAISAPADIVNRRCVDARDASPDSPRQCRAACAKSRSRRRWEVDRVRSSAPDALSWLALALPVRLVEPRVAAQAGGGHLERVEAPEQLVVDAERRHAEEAAGDRLVGRPSKGLPGIVGRGI